MSGSNKFSVGPTKYSKGGWLEFSFYAVGSSPEKRIALILVDEQSSTEGPLMVCTCNFPDTDPVDGCVWIKNWSENEGIFEALIECGIGTPTKRHHDASRVIAHELRLSDEVHAEARRVIDGLLATA
jgi:hypothetical protein